MGFGQVGEHVFNFDDCTFQGLSIGDKVDKNSLNEKLFHKELGCRVYVSDGSVTGFFFCLNEGYNGYSKFYGLFVKSGVALDMSSMTSTSDIIKIFGEPSSKWDDGTEGNLEFELKGGRILEFSWNTSSAEHELDYLIVE